MTETTTPSAFADVPAQLATRLSTLAALVCKLEDESHQHAGHAGARQGGHYRLHLVSAAFAGKNTVARHRMVYALLGDLMQNGIHALSLRLQTPEEAGCH